MIINVSEMRGRKLNYMEACVKKYVKAVNSGQLCVKKDIIYRYKISDLALSFFGYEEDSFDDGRMRYVKRRDENND